MTNDDLIRELREYRCGCGDALPAKLLERLAFVLADDPENDATDFAHPAWWRGQEDGVHGACMRVNEALDGKNMGRMREPLETTCARVADLARKCPACKSKDYETMYSAPILYRCRKCGHTWKGKEIETLTIEEYRKRHPGHDV